MSQHLFEQLTLVSASALTNSIFSITEDLSLPLKASPQTPAVGASASDNSISRSAGDSSLPLEASTDLSAGASSPVNSTFRNEEETVQATVYRGTRELSQRKTKEVIGDEFLSNTCSIAHICTPVPYAKDKDNRLAYEVVCDIKSNQLYAGRCPRQVYEEALSKTDELYDEDVVMAFYGEGYSQRRQTISRAINTFKDREVTLQNIPDDLVFLQDGTRFVHVHVMEPQLHIYYSEKTIQKTCANDLFAVVADGVHSNQPKNLAQLYCVHGVCAGGVEVPLVYALTARKHEATYRRIFKCLQNNFELFRPRPMQRLRVVLDFEHAAINAAYSLFPDAVVQGCSFHLPQSWNRKRDSCRITRFIRGPGRDGVVEEWWDTIKGVIFLPKGLRSEVRALRAPPVSSEHPAYGSCWDFLNYLTSTWLTGPFEDLWCKWGITDLRTTNLAEAFHNKLNATFTGDHPDMRTLLEKLRTLDLEAKCNLRWSEMNPGVDKRIRRRDLERRQSVEESMARFDAAYRAGATVAQIEKFCRDMSRFISGKTV
ncbi:unnamed protein product [Cylicocyclus nassatus]|uniref:MULE transposase domain-containing protein n=1 Tax=Cylicocyclus nassatus TaxID=53992 RepID=A0AA36DLH5_CYLNA|nr:unnamed protein product [Cylicocyclus nassatus]